MVSLLLLSSCGFKPRGSGFENLAGQTVVLLSNNNFGPLERRIRQQLTVFSITVDTSKPLQDNNGFKINHIKSQRSTLSVDATGRPAEYESIISVDVSFNYKNNQQSQQLFKVQRDYRYDKNNTLAHDRELEILTTEMYDDLAHRIVTMFLGQLKTSVVEI